MPAGCQPGRAYGQRAPARGTRGAATPGVVTRPGRRARVSPAGLPRVAEEARDEPVQAERVRVRVRAPQHRGLHRQVAVAAWIAPPYSRQRWRPVRLAPHLAMAHGRNCRPRAQSVEPRATPRQQRPLSGSASGHSWRTSAWVVLRRSDQQAKQKRPQYRPENGPNWQASAGLSNRDRRHPKPHRSTRRIPGHREHQAVPPSPQRPGADGGGEPRPGLPALSAVTS